jgi:hypothetical protein
MNRTNKLSVGIVSLGLLILTAAACRADDIEESTNAMAYMPAQPLFHPFTIGAEVGTMGYGGSVDWRFLNHFGVGSSFDYLTYTYNGKIEDANYDIHLHLQSEPLTLNVYPWKRSSFHFSVGALFNQNRITGTSIVGAGDSVTINGTTYNGPIDLHLTIKQEPVDPYLTLGGNLYFDHGHHVSLGGQLGVVYTGQPKVSFYTTPTISPSDQQAEQEKIKHYARDFIVWPVAKISLNYSF